MSAKEIAKLGKVAKRADIDAGFKYLELCQPPLVLELITLLRQGGVQPETEGDYERIEGLSKAAAGKRAISDEGMAFAEACKPPMIASWCEKALSL